MAEQFLVVDGVDLTPYMAYGGFKWSRADLDSEETKRLLDGNLERHYVTTKYNVTVTCKPLTTAQASVVLQAIKPPRVTAQYLDPEVGGRVTRQVYANNIPANIVARLDDGGDYLWDGIEFSLIEY